MTCSPFEKKNIYPPQKVQIDINKTGVGPIDGSVLFNNFLPLFFFFFQINLCDAQIKKKNVITDHIK